MQKMPGGSAGHLMATVFSQSGKSVRGLRTSAVGRFSSYGAALLDLPQMHPHQNVLVVVAEAPSEHVDAARAAGFLVDANSQTDR